MQSLKNHVSVIEIILNILRPKPMPLLAVCVLLKYALIFASERNAIDKKSESFGVILPNR